MRAVLALILFALCSNLYAMTSDESKQFVKDAVVYALTNKDPNMDYSKYVSKSFKNPIDGNVFNYQQWVAHQKHIKSLVKSMKPTFDEMVAEGNNIAAIYHIDIVKNDGSKLVVKDMAFFKLKNNKVVYCEELTRLIKGKVKDKNIGSTK
ncbi:MAG: hypothetical protein SFW07_00705 [Gammaproteobacteria bacterium]|nr:hypothetical protein [Gammaproteobacteria bacterium]